MGDERGGGDSMDIISSLPDDILHHILSFLPTYPAITTCVLSRRWRHIWRGTPCLSLDCEEETAESVQKTLQYHTAPKLSSLHLGFRFDTEFVEFPEPITHHQFFIVDPWVEFAHSHHTQNLSFDFRLANYVNYKFPHIFYVNSYVKRLTLAFHGFTTLLPGSPVFWPSLTSLSLERCRITDESAANILSGCPLLQSLTLVFCRMLRRLDLTKSTRLTRLDLVIGIMNTGPTGPTAIIAPHIHFFSFQNSETPFTLDHLSSLTQAKLNLFQYQTPDFSQDFVLKMLAKLHNIDMLTLGSIFLQTSSLAELRGLPFPILKITALTFETEIFRYVVPGIARLLQNSPGLKKLTLRLLKCYTVEEKYLDSYADSRGVEFGILPTSSEPKLIASFIEFLLGNTKTLETLVVRLEDNLDPTRFEELLEMVPTLSQNHNVSIVLRPGPLFPDVHRKDKYVSPFS